MKIILSLALLLCLSGCYEDKMRKQFAAQGCKYYGEEILPEKRYCGKACFRNIRREWYTCNDSKNDYRAYFDH